MVNGAQNADEFTDLRTDLSALPDLPIDRAQWERALEVHAGLAQQGGMHHRSVKHPHLLIAAGADPPASRSCTTTRITTASPRQLGSRFGG